MSASRGGGCSITERGATPPLPGVYCPGMSTKRGVFENKGLQASFLVFPIHPWPHICIDTCTDAHVRSHFGLGHLGTDGLPRERR